MCTAEQGMEVIGCGVGSVDFGYECYWSACWVHSMRRRGVWTLKNFTKSFGTYIQPQLTMYRYSLSNTMPLGQDTQPADQANVPMMSGTTEEVVEPLNVRKLGVYPAPKVEETL